MNNVIDCPNCGQKNRVNSNADTSQAICAKCWAKLEASQKTVQPPPLPKEPYTPPPTANDTVNKNTASRRAGFLWVFLFLAGGLLWLVISQDSNNVSKKAPALNYSEVTMPRSGAEQIYTTDERIAPLKIETSGGTNYLVKLVSAYSKDPVMTIFIQGGNTISTEVPLGTYEVKYALGKKWYGYKHRFGPETIYTKAEKLFVFEKTGYQVSGYTIILYSVSDGNLQTSRINPAQF